MEKQNITQQNHTLASQIKMYYNTKTKARYIRLLQHPAWKWRGPILIWALHKFVTYLLTRQGDCTGIR